MRADIVVVMPPHPTFVPDIGQASEAVRVDTLGPNQAIERLTKCIVGQFAGPAEVGHDIMLAGPQVEVLSDKLGVLVDADAASASHIGPRSIPACQPNTSLGYATPAAFAAELKKQWPESTTLVRKNNRPALIRTKGRDRGHVSIEAHPAC